MRVLMTTLVAAMWMALPALAEEAASGQVLQEPVGVELVAPELPVLDQAVPEPENAEQAMPELPETERAAPEVEREQPEQDVPGQDGPERKIGGPEERLWTCETSLSGVKTEVNYVRDDEFRENVGRLEKNFSGWGRISCPGYVTLREILRRNQMADDGSYCLLWDKANDTYIGARIGARKGNALCRKTFCERVNGARAATFQSANAVALAGYDAVTQRPGAAILAATSGQMVGTLEAAGVTAAGVAASPLAVGSLVIGTAAVGGTMWYCAEE